MFLIKLRQNCFYGSYKIEDFMLRGVMCKAHLLTSLNQQLLLLSIFNHTAVFSLSGGGSLEKFQLLFGVARSNVWHLEATGSLISQPRDPEQLVDSNYTEEIADQTHRKILLNKTSRNQIFIHVVFLIFNYIQNSLQSLLPTYMSCHALLFDDEKLCMIKEMKLH